jgi:hypothetical protein
MKILSLLVLSSCLLQSCSAGLWGSSKVDPIAAEQDLPLAPTSRFDYKLSFKKNFYYNETVPFWTTGGGNKSKIVCILVSSILIKSLKT